MPLFIALLRGVNVGKANRVPMAQLRALLADLGYTRIATLLNSGNVVFHADRGAPIAHAAAITAALAGNLGIKVPVVVKSANEFAVIVGENPIETAETEHPRLLVAFVQDVRRLTALADAIEPLVVAPERFAVGQQAAYLLCAGGILESRAASNLLGKRGEGATSRNWATVRKLNALIS